MRRVSTIVVSTARGRMVDEDDDEGGAVMPVVGAAALGVVDGAAGWVMRVARQ